jgi:hypothetical protein
VAWRKRPANIIQCPYWSEVDVLAATKVPGRKNIVRTAIAFMADESLLLSRAISLLCSEIRALSLLPRVLFLN